MLISQKHGFVFFCMPKCASNSIETMLRPHCDIHLAGSPHVRHTNVREFKAYLQPYLSEIAGIREIESICLIREPVSWLSSWYRFRARHELRGAGHPHSTAHVDFEGFVRAYLSNPRPPFANIGSQFAFLSDGRGHVGVDRLFAYHDLGGVVDYFSLKTGARLEIRTLNVSPRKVYASNLIERADALKRRLSHLLPGRTTPPAPVAGGPKLSPGLYDELRRAIPRDFELYENFT